MIAKILTLFFSLNFLLINMVYSQPPCEPNSVGLYFSFPQLSTYPPLTTDMPLDVLVGYIATDSLARCIHIDEAREFLDRQTFNDTMEYIMRYYYQMSDYNAFRLHQFLKYSPFNYGNLPDGFEKIILDKIRTISPTSFLHRLLLSSSIIAHIEVTDTFRVYQPDAFLCKNLNIVTCSIIDTIKGKYIPLCMNEIHHNTTVSSIQSIPLKCLQFEYCCEWERGMYGKCLCDSAGNAWVKEGMEYIVFLRPRLICSDSSTVYMNLTPVGNKSYYFSMYPIINGYVQDEKNELGFGVSVEVDEFKNQLREEISGIINYGK